MVMRNWWMIDVKWRNICNGYKIRLQWAFLWYYMFPHLLSLLCTVHAQYVLAKMSLSKYKLYVRQTCIHVLYCGSRESTRNAQHPPREKSFLENWCCRWNDSVAFHSAYNSQFICRCSSLVSKICIFFRNKCSREFTNGRQNKN